MMMTMTMTIDMVPIFVSIRSKEKIWYQKRNVQEAQDSFDREFHVLKDLQMEPNIYPIRFIVFYPFLPLRIEYSNLAKSSFIYKLLTVRIEEA